MITVYVEKFNIQDEKDYEKFIENLDIFLLECPSCRHKGCLIRHAKYKRRVVTKKGIIYIEVVRVICKECGKTHAVMPICIIPYQKLQLEDQISVDEEMESYGEITVVAEKYEYLDINYLYYIYE